MPPSVFERVEFLLNQHGIAFQTLRHEPVYTSEEAARIRGTPLASGAKALICRGDAGFVMFVIPADRKLDSHAVRRATCWWKNLNRASLLSRGRFSWEALKAGDHGKDVETIEYRKRFFPGDKYVDIAGIDIYTNAWYGWGDFREDSFPKAFQIMGQITPGKMLALCECQGLPNPEIMAKDGPRWRYCLPWYVGKDPKWNPPDWVKEVYSHEVFITLDRLPKWSRRDQGSAGRGPCRV